MIIKFSDIIGQNALKSRLMQSVLDGDPSQAYILDGEKYSGRKTLASAFSAALQCEKKGREACGKCHSCKMAAAGTHPDIIHLSPGSLSARKTDAGKQLSYRIEDIRSEIIDDIGMKPFYGPYKIYILDEAETLNAASQNALLKTLEDPPPHGIIMLLTEDSDVFLDTVRSRCTAVSMMPLPDSEMIRHIIKRVSIPEYEARMIASFAHGNIGRAFYLADNTSSDSKAFSDIRSSVAELLSHIDDRPVDVLLNDASEMISTIDKEYPGHIRDIFDFFLIWYRDVLIFKSIEDKTRLTFQEESYAISQTARRQTFSQLKSDIEAVLNARKQLAANVNGERALSQLILSLH